MKRMNIGRLNKRVDIMGYVTSKDEMGQSKQSLQKLATVWADIKPMRGSELYEVGRLQSKMTHRIYIRYLPDVTTSNWIVYNGKRFNIVSVVNPDYENKYLEIYAEYRTGKAVIDNG